MIGMLFAISWSNVVKDAYSFAYKAWWVTFDIRLYFLVLDCSGPSYELCSIQITIIVNTWGNYEQLSKFCQLKMLSVNRHWARDGFQRFWFVTKVENFLQQLVIKRLKVFLKLINIDWFFWLNNRNWFTLILSYNRDCITILDCKELHLIDEGWLFADLMVGLIRVELSFLDVAIWVKEDRTSILDFDHDQIVSSKVQLASLISSVLSN